MIENKVTGKTLAHTHPCTNNAIRSVDLYDRLDVIPFDRMESFFREHLK